jgi:hypothetical protein
MLARLVILTHEFNLKGANRGARVLSRGHGVRQGVMRNYEEQRRESKPSTAIDPRSRPANMNFYWGSTNTPLVPGASQVNDQSCSFFFFSSCRSDGQDASERTTKVHGSEI